MGTTYLESRDRHIAGMVDRERKVSSKGKWMPMIKTRTKAQKEGIN